MKNTFLVLCVVAGAALRAGAQGCSSCGGSSASLGNDVGPHFFFSMGAAQYGQSAGDMIVSESVPDPALFTPATLQYDAPLRTDVTVITSNAITTQVTNQISAGVATVTNTYTATNWTVSGGVTNFTVLTNTYLSYVPAVSSNAVTTYSTNAIIRQILAPQALADIPVPPTTNGYVINFYYLSQLGSVNPDGTYSVSGTPFITWVITNPAPSTINQLQVSEYGNVPSYGLMKKWTCTYSTSTGGWSIEPLGSDTVENTLVTNLSNTNWEIVNTVQSPSGPVVKQVKNTYAVFDWSASTNTAPTETDVGSSGAPEVTTYSYQDPADFNAGSIPLLETVVHPDGSQEYYAGYDTNGNPTEVYSTFQDNSEGRYTQYVYDPVSAGVSGSGDNGTLSPRTPREVVQEISGTVVSQSYTVFPSVGMRLDIQCTTPSPSGGWSDPSNLTTTNLFYTNGPNQFALAAVIRPDGTAAFYNYITNGTYETNIVASGQPDATCSYIVDGMSNVTVLNLFGYNVSSASYDVKSGITLSQDIYANFDSYSRPQQVTHLDGTTEYTYYACCGLDYTIDKDGVENQYVYDTDKRQLGYEKIYGSSVITYTNVLDADGRSLALIRVGSDNSTITMSQSAYDLASELVARTNALGGAATYSRTNDPTTGGLIRTMINPDGSAITNYYYADGTLKQIVGSGVHGKGYSYGEGTDVNGNQCTYVIETNLNANGTPSSEWTQTYSDMAGRTTEVYYSDGSYSQSFYNSLGQLLKTIDPDGVTTLYDYDGMGQVAQTAIDMNRNGTIDLSGPDRVTWTTNDVLYDSSVGANVQRARTYAFDVSGSSTPDLISMTEASVDGLNRWQTQYRDASAPVTTHNQTVPGVSRTVTNSAPDSSYTLSGYSYGRLVSIMSYNSAGTQVAGTSYGYDPHGRQNVVTDARNGATTYSFNNADKVTNATAPLAETTTTYYDLMLRGTNATQPDGTSVTSIYLLTGELGEQYGSRTYPVAYSYDYAGRMKTMTNWSNFSGGTGARVTTWTYDGYRGFLTNKTYDGGTPGPGYTYTAAGRLASRTWVRGVRTTYFYDNGGSLTNVSYSDGTPGVTNTIDRLARLSAASWTNITDTLSYNLASQLTGESFSGGTLAGLRITNTYDPYLRRTNLASLNGSTTLTGATYGYDNASRLSTVTNGSCNVSYSYIANSPLVGQITFRSNTVMAMTTTKSYDYLNRLLSTSNAPSSGSGLNYNYSYNTANQRTSVTNIDGSYWSYQYDSLGQVTSGKKYWWDGTPAAGQQFTYAFDTIGNRTQTQTGGDQNGANLRMANYTNNSLNQLTSRDVPGYLDIKGVSIATNTVTVNSNTAYRKWEYFREEIPANNASAPQWTNVTVTATGQSPTNGFVFLAQTPETFAYDADGNLTNDGRWSYVWDAENRLVQMTAHTNAGPHYQLTFVYDSKSRRIQKNLVSNSVAICTNRFLYDGWNLVVTLNPQSSILQSFLWGMDLSRTIKGAGGVGGLLEVGYSGSSTTNCFAAYDGNGNIAGLINAADGTTIANYEYGPFGELIRATGPMAFTNPFRFSTKYQDDESDLLCYGYRYYNASRGKWFTRDPINETAFINLTGRNLAGGNNDYEFANNAAINAIDLLGLKRRKTGVQRCQYHDWNNHFHAFVSIDGQGWGFYPSNWFVLVCPGAIDPDEPGGVPCHEITLDDCFCDINKFRKLVNDKINHDKANPPIYSFFFYNCADWTRDVIDPSRREACNGMAGW